MTTERELVTTLPDGRYVLAYGDGKVCLYRLPGVQPVEQPRQPAKFEELPKWIQNDTYIGFCKMRMAISGKYPERIAKEQALIDERVAQLLRR